MNIYITGADAVEVEVTGYEDRDAGFATDASDLEENVGIADVMLSDVPSGAIPQLRDPELAHGFPLRILDDDNVTTIFRGRIDEVTLQAKTGRLDWRILAADENTRALEAEVGSLDRSAVTDTDRNHVIAAFRAALTAQAWGVGTVTDAIIPANEPDWTGVKATTSFAGRNWSYQGLKQVIDSMRDFAPDARWRIRSSDRLVEYGPVGATEAPFVVGDFLRANGTTVRQIEDDTYRERWMMAGHRNKYRQGGAAASEATATDEASYARIGRVLDAGYKNDTAIPAGDVRRIAYATLAAKRRRRTFFFTVRDKGLVAGQALAIVNSTAPAAWRAPWPESLFPVMARSDSGVLSDMRGWVIVQKVKPSVVGVQQYSYEVEAGDYIRDLPTVISDAAAVA